ncbi:MAG TPA: CBS domain-containing protein [Thermodesulfobacteriota bacterium]|nr:CBS domain-containing protein [Thermodesulfobacteriota bacterium]
MLVKHCMTPNPITVTPDEDVKATFNMLKEYGFRQVPVVENGQLTGMVTDRDMRAGLAQPSLKVGEVMSSNPVTIWEDAPVEKAAEIIRKHKFNALPVISKRGELIGIITTTDILEGFYNLLNFHEEPMRIQVKITEGVNLYDVLRLLQICSDKVLSFSASKESSDKFYFWLVECDFEKLDRKLREKELNHRVTYWKETPDRVPESLR